MSNNPETDLEARALNLGKKALDASIKTTEMTKRVLNAQQTSSEQQIKSTLNHVLQKFPLDKPKQSSKEDSNPSETTETSFTKNVIVVQSKPIFLFVIVIIISVSIFSILEASAALSNGSDNWAEIRCQPHMMPLASMYGYDTAENIQFCLNNVIQEKTKSSLGPLAQGMGGFSGILGNLMESANSFRTTLSTMVGGIIRLITEFKARMEALMARVKMTASRMRMMMFRVFGTMFSVVYMGMSAMTAVVNFTDTFVFGFLELFCFPQTQEIRMIDGSNKQIQYCKTGDILYGDHKVISTYSFLADGHSMVQIGSVVVSSNHLIMYENKWIYSKDHPDAYALGPWIGGIEKPLYCLSTDTHKIPIDSYIFTDYDETEEGDQETQAFVHKSLNGTKEGLKQDSHTYEIGSPEFTKIKTLHGMIPLQSLKLGEFIDATTRIIGIQKSRVNEVCQLPDGSFLAAGSLVWDANSEKWLRAHMLYKKSINTLHIDFISLFLNKKNHYTLENGSIVRDALEVNSKDTMKAYVNALL